MRADFAARGWSLQADLGSRLRYADAIALFKALSGDPATSTGAHVAGLKYPTSFADMFTVAALTQNKFPSPIPTEEEQLRAASFKASGDEAQKAAENMAPLFASLYE